MCPEALFASTCFGNLTSFALVATGIFLKLCADRRLILLPVSNKYEKELLATCNLIKGEGVCALCLFAMLQTMEARDRIGLQRDFTVEMRGGSVPGGSDLS